MSICVNKAQTTDISSMPFVVQWKSIKYFLAVSNITDKVAHLNSITDAILIK